MSNVLPLESIIIDRANRQRRTLTGIEELADSISRTGLIHPPVVTRERVLVAGERRITAMKHLGMSACPVTYTDELEPRALALIELEENIRRQDLGWQDQVRAVRDYHHLCGERDPAWTQSQTEKALGFKKENLAKYLRIAEELSSGHDLVVNAPSLSVAAGVTERIRERRKANEQAALASAPTIQRSTADRHAAPPSAVAAPKAAPVKPKPAPPILHVNFHEWSEAYAGEPFNFLHCDFPYGVNADKRQQGTSTHKHGAYADSPDIYWGLLERLAANLDRVCAPSCHLMFWFSMDYYAETMRFFNAKTDFIIQPFPLYWWKTDNVGLLPDPSRGPRRVVETAFIGSRGDRKIVQAVANCYGAATVRDEHMSIKPEPVLKHFFRMFVDENTTLLDPTCGSGSAVRVGKASGAHRVLGLEANPEFARRAAERFDAPSPDSVP